jgi:hypothetical protein
MNTTLLDTTLIDAIALEAGYKRIESVALVNKDKDRTITFHSWDEALELINFAYSFYAWSEDRVIFQTTENEIESVPRHPRNLRL